MKLEYDKEIDAAYIYLEYPIKDGESKKTVELKQNVVLDFDKKGKLLGVEILNASKMLNKSVLSGAIKKSMFSTVEGMKWKKEEDRINSREL